MSEAASFLAHKLRFTPPDPSKQRIDRSLIAYADKYHIEGNIEEQLLELAKAVILRLRGADGYYEQFTADVILQMNKEYFGCIVDAHYTKNSKLSKLVEQTIKECQKHSGTTFTATELLLSAKCIVKDYDRFVRYGESVKTI